MRISFNSIELIHIYREYYRIVDLLGISYIFLFHIKYIFFLFVCSEKPLMCHRKLPPSFWNSAYKPPQLATGSNFDYSRDPYFPSSWYSLQNNWPYRLPPHSHTDLGGSLPYSSFDAPGKFGSTYQSLMFPGSYDSRQSKYDFAKNMESLAGTSSYYGLSRLGMDFTAKGNVEPPVTGIKSYLNN